MLKALFLNDELHFVEDGKLNHLNDYIVSREVLEYAIECGFPVPDNVEIVLSDWIVMFNDDGECVEILKL